MFILIVLCGIFLLLPKVSPGYVNGGYGSYGYNIPIATSYASRIDHLGKGVPAGLDRGNPWRSKAPIPISGSYGGYGRLGSSHYGLSSGAYGGSAGIYGGSAGIYGGGSGIYGHGIGAYGVSSPGLGHGFGAYDIGTSGYGLGSHHSYPVSGYGYENNIYPNVGVLSGLSSAGHDYGDDYSHGSVVGTGYYGYGLHAGH